MTGPTRRAFLAGTAGVAAFAAADALAGDGGPAPRPEPLPRRKFGATASTVTPFGLGCFPLGSVPDDDAGIAIARRALEGGCRYFDTAPSYGNGRSETRLGRALEGWPRDDVFVATKSHLPRTAANARRELDGSLKRLRLERVDLVQVHAVADAADLDAVLAKGGLLEGLLKARDEGLVRHVGVTGHADPKTMRSTFERFGFDSILFPMNCSDPHHLSFVRETLPAAVEKGLARLAMKVFASGTLLQAAGDGTKGVDAESCLRYVFGLDVTAAVVGCGTADEVDLALRVARDPKPLSREETEALLRATLAHRTALQAEKRPVEWYKRS